MDKENILVVSRPFKTWAEAQKEQCLSAARRLVYDLTATATQLGMAVNNEDMDKVVWITRTCDSNLSVKTEAVRDLLHFINVLEKCK